MLPFVESRPNDSIDTPELARLPKSICVVCWTTSLKQELPVTHIVGNSEYVGDESYCSQHTTIASYSCAVGAVVDIIGAVGIVSVDDCKLLTGDWVAFGFAVVVVAVVVDADVDVVAVLFGFVVVVVAVVLVRLALAIDVVVDVAVVVGVLVEMEDDSTGGDEDGGNVCNVV